MISNNKLSFNLNDDKVPIQTDVIISNPTDSVC